MSVVRPSGPRGLAVVGLVAAALGWAAPAEAQFFVQTETSTPYVALANIPGITAVTDFAFSSRDEGRATLTLPFSYRFLGNPYTDVQIGVNGLLVFGNGRFGSYFNYPIGSSSSSNNMIAVWWDDLILPNAAGHSSYGVLGTAPNRIFIIEVRDWEHWSLGNILDGRYQVWLYEGALGRFEVRYDRLLTDTENYTATAGWEGNQGDGEPNGVFRPCSSASPYCDHTDYATMAGQMFRVEQAQGPELVGAIGDFGRGALPGQTQTVPVSLRNLGTEDAPNVVSELYLSADEALDASDTLIATFTTPNVPLGGGQVDVDVSAVVPAAMPAGDYYVILNVDAPDDLTEPSETNNQSVATGMFATAHELSWADVVAPGGARPGQALQVELTIDSAGVPFTGPLTVDLLATRDRVVDPRDTNLGPVTVNLTGAAQERLTTTVTVPANIGPGGFYVVATLDPQGTLPQFDRTNDSLMSDQPFPTAADFVPVSVTGPAGAEPGQTIVFDLVVENRGLDHVGLVGIRAIASPDPIYDLNDIVLGQITADLTLAPGQSRTVQVPVTVPALPPGNLYPILLVDPGRLVDEVSDFNNNRVGDDTFATGPDFTVTDIAGPREAAGGETVTFMVDVESLGSAFPGAVQVALLLSEDDVLDAQDVLANVGTVSIGGRRTATATLTFSFPPVPPGEYRVFARVDPTGAVVEADEGNNVYLDRRDIETGPDFYIFGVAVNPRQATTQAELTVTGSFRNYGTDYAGPVEYNVYLSEDSRYDPSDLQVAQGVVTLASGDTGLTLTSTFTLDETGVTVPPGEYDVIVVMDPRDLVPEQDNWDNEDDGGQDLVVQGGNGLVTNLASEPIAFVGQPYQVELDLLNDGALDIEAIDVAIYWSDVGVLLEGVELGRTATVSVPAGTTVTVTTTVSMPANAAPGWYLLGAAVDPDNRVLEENERDNLVLRPGGLTLLAPAPDLVAQITQSATSAASGEALAITRYVQNLGVDAAPSVELQYVLSLDDVIDDGDRVIGTASVALGGAPDDLAIDIIDVPAGVPAGRYRLGIRVDPGRAVAEVDDTNNDSLGPWIDVFPAGFRILNEVLPVGVVGADYEARLFAVGASQTVLWTLASGTLPLGLVFEGTTGEIRGTPSEEGRFELVIEARSGGPAVQRTFVLTVLSYGPALTVDPSLQLPVGAVGFAYEGRLRAIGGQPPYRFSVVSGLPNGLVAEPDGRIHGIPELVGSWPVRVRVDDAAAASASAITWIRVLGEDHRVQIVQDALRPAQLGKAYCEDAVTRFVAEGGVAPYRWSVDAALPAGMILGEEDGVFCGTPTAVGAHEVWLRVVDAQGVVDLARFELEVLPEDGFAITTRTLHDAATGEAYEARLDVLGGTAPYTWALALGELPAGLTLEPEGRIVGTPAAASRAAFLVEVVDASGQRVTRPLGLRVEDPAATDDGGCTCARPSASPPAWPWLGLGLLLLTHRRRATRRRRRR